MISKDAWVELSHRKTEDLNNGRLILGKFIGLSSFNLLIYIEDFKFASNPSCNRYGK